VQELRGFRGQYDHAHGQAGEALTHVRAWQDIAQTPAHGPTHAWMPYLIGGFVLVPIGLAIIAHEFGVELLFDPAHAILGLFGVVLVVGLLAISLRGGGSAATRTRAGASARVELHRVSCPSCGATNDYDPRTSHASCSHCSSPLFPTETILARSLDNARATRQRALLERYRHERAGMAQLALTTARVAQARTGVASVAYISILVAVVLSLMTQQVLTQELPGAALGLWLVLPLGWIILSGIQRRQATLRDRWAVALGTVARQGRGVVDTDVAKYLAWFDRHWGGPYEITYTSFGPWFCSIRLTLGGYPLLIDLNPKPPHDGPAYANILLAAFIPGISELDGPPSNDLPREVQALWTPMREQEVTLELSPAGLLARLNRTQVREFCGQPESTTRLTRVVAHMVAVANELGAVGGSPSASAPARVDPS